MNWYFDRTPVRNVDDLIRRSSPSALASPYRSTVPLLSLLKHEADGFGEVVASRLGLNESPTSLHFEFEVSPPKGQGTASHTDAMVMTGGQAVAVEAKWTEHRYATVGRWLQRGGNGSNRRLVVDGWISLLNRHGEGPLDLETIMGLPYQLIHRAASACATERRPALMYLQFLPQSGGTSSVPGYVCKDLRGLHKAMGSPDGFRFFVLEVELELTERFVAIADLPKGCATTGSAVIEALLDGPLFEFKRWGWHST